MKVVLKHFYAGEGIFIRLIPDANLVLEVLIMYTCKPAKRSMVFIYLLVIAVALGITVITEIFDYFLKDVGYYILLSVWIIASAFLFLLIPLYYKKTRFSVSEEDIVKYTFLFSFKYQYMTMDSVKSISTIVTPLSKITGLNFIIINALGAKIILPFLNKNDCREISLFFNHIISGRQKRPDNSSKE